MQVLDHCHTHLVIWSSLLDILCRSFSLCRCMSHSSIELGPFCGPGQLQSLSVIAVIICHCSHCSHYLLTPLMSSKDRKSQLMDWFAVSNATSICCIASSSTGCSAMCSHICLSCEQNLQHTVMLSLMHTWSKSISCIICCPGEQLHCGEGVNLSADTQQVCK